KKSVTINKIIRVRMAMVYLIWRAMFGNGVRIGMTAILATCVWPAATPSIRMLGSPAADFTVWLMCSRYYSVTTGCLFCI
ncbi:MAG: hypothetical protein VCF25_02050, partial [Candidatus Poribacteria bacterium]